MARCSTCDISIIFGPGEFITFCKKCSGIAYLDTMIVRKRRRVTVDDVRGERTKFKRRLRSLEDRQKDLTENGRGHSESKRQLANVSAAKWQVEQGLRVLAKMEGKLTKAVDGVAKKARLEVDDVVDINYEEEEKKCDGDEEEDDEFDTDEDEKESSGDSDDEEEEASFEFPDEAEKEKAIETPAAEKSRVSFASIENMAPVIFPPELDRRMVASLPSRPPYPWGLAPGMPLNYLAAFPYGSPLSPKPVEFKAMMPDALKQIIVSPQEKITFNGPFSRVQSSQIKLKNPSGSRVAWKITCENHNQLNQIETHPTSGILQYGVELPVTLICKPLIMPYPGQTSDDRLVIEWIIIPAGIPYIGQSFDQWLDYSLSPTRRYDLSITYSP